MSTTLGQSNVHPHMFIQCVDRYLWAYKVKMDDFSKSYSWNAIFGAKCIENASKNAFCRMTTIACLVSEK